MTILFTPVGTTDPVRGYHDGAMLHILRHYPVDKVIVFLTEEMGEHEKNEGWYSKGIQSVKKECPVEWIYSGIKNPQQFNELTVLQEAFGQVYSREAKDTEWLLNISSGTPQMKTVMSLLAIDYDRTKAIQVNSPERKSNVGIEPNKEQDMLEMLGCNYDIDSKEPNRCIEPKLRLLRKYGIRLQIASLVENYEYGGALDILRQNKELFPGDTERLLRHAVDRENLQWKEANKVIASYQGKQLIPSANEFTEYFRVMILKQLKGQLPDFIIKLSPILLELGKKYMEKLEPQFRIQDCGYLRGGDRALVITRRNMEAYCPKLLSYMDNQFPYTGFRDAPLSMDIITYVCEYLKLNDKKQDTDHAKLTDLFTRLRLIEQLGRNPIAHTITNLTEEKLKHLKTKEGKEVGMNSKELLSRLQEAICIVTRSKIALDYDRLNGYILKSMKEN